MPRMYRDSVYTQFSIFCGQAVQTADDKCQTFNVTNTIGNILHIIAMILLLPTGIGYLVFAALSALLAAGMIAFYGGISALIASNPALGGLLIGVCGLSFTTTIWGNREIIMRIHGVVVSYESDFKKCETDTEVEDLMDRLVKDIVICSAKHWGFLMLLPFEWRTG